MRCVLTCRSGKESRVECKVRHSGWMNSIYVQRSVWIQHDNAILGDNGTRN